MAWQKRAGLIVSAEMEPIRDQAPESRVTFVKDSAPSKPRLKDAGYAGNADRPPENVVRFRVEWWTDPWPHGWS